MSEQLSNPLEELARAAETFRFEVPRSHRGLPGLGVTAAKNAFLRALKPMHIETLRPQREFNLAALKAAVSYTHLDVYKRQQLHHARLLNQARGDRITDVR